MFSLLKRCKYSLYSDTMLHFGSQTLVELHASRTNEDVRMYTCRIFILVDVVTLLYMDELNKHWKNAALYTLATKE